MIFDGQVVAKDINSCFAKNGQEKTDSAGEVAFLYAREESGNSYFSHAVTREDMPR